MNTVIDLRAFVSTSNSRLLVMIDLLETNYTELVGVGASDLIRSLENCRSAIRHARSVDLPIAFTRPADGPGSTERPVQSAWISGFEPKRSDMVFERPQPSCYSNQLFDDIVSQIGNFTMAGLVAERTCLATAIDAAHRGHNVTFLRDASVSCGRHDVDARAVHIVTTQAIELFAGTATTRDWLVAMAPRNSRGRRYG
ncbi:MAG: isochorismatase family protein [Bradyrhizobium sp.]|uniref:isochorismatase family protein n=1 Tax=Bradyrhizobium sp. TaxID=376 RepID=UPI001C28D3B2|nr:isochorismatase family protein [Bradyrhizobium sp.]MBU6463913.1 cysteine hydrolase [Pseudomonadota bacterium]MDE2067719.1 isochorismatase family protein [Bradyrhizobium sp.]MDE2242053.1 isochorismatase family protein [Bradyrhizobium sp.]MDE2471654.1 isochorismatase family protein [Bradyrhizobium sp.]